MTKKSKVRDQYLRRKYGVTLKEYNAKLKEQGGSCALCGAHKSKFTRALAQDHNHSTGEPRGILCFYCNKYRVGRLTKEWAYRVWCYLSQYDGKD